MSWKLEAPIILIFLVCAQQVSGYLQGPPNQYVLEGSSLNFTCYSDDTEGGISWYQYTKDGERLRPLEAVSYTRNKTTLESTVMMENISMSEDRTGVECWDTFEGHLARIYVIPREDVPILEPSNETMISAVAGESAAFYCAVSPGEESILTWSRDGCLLKEEEEEEGVSNSTFMIPVVTEWDGGIYVCSVVNREYLHAPHVASDKQEYHLLVKMSLVQDVSESGQLLRVPQGTDAYMYCGIAGYPIEVKWTRNDEETLSVLNDIYGWTSTQTESTTCTLEVDLGPVYSVQNQGKTLVIKNFTLADEGTYVCKGRQDGREMQHTFVVKLSGQQLSACNGVLLLSFLAVFVQYFV